MDSWIFYCYLQVLGIVENMSCFKCPHCGEPSYIFGKGGAKVTAADMGLELLGEVSVVFWLLKILIFPVSLIVGTCQNDTEVLELPSI